jgi:hypothetical protein
MDEEFRNRIAAFLFEYINITDSRYGYCDGEVIEQGIKLLINSGAFSIPEMQRECAINHSLIIPTKFITDCLI